MSLEEHESRKGRSYKLMLIFAMISIVMVFAGLTSAYIVSKSRPDWLSDFVLPSAFIFSTVVIVLSSVTFYFAHIYTCTHTVDYLCEYFINFFDLFVCTYTVLSAYPPTTKCT
jgi:heme/copper-type cytochrome/quinol oxidase subunit 3